MPTPVSAPAGSPQGSVPDEDSLLDLDLDLHTSRLSLLNAVHDLILVLDQECRVVTANKAMLEFLGNPDIKTLTGRRPGDIFQCTSHLEYLNQGGCGVSPACGSCGLVKAFAEATEGLSGQRDYRMLRSPASLKSAQAAEFKVRTSVIELDGRPLIVAALVDQTREKHRRSMERIFFHDVLNTMGGLLGLTECLQAEAPEAMQPDISLFQSALDAVMDEVLGQKALIEAESGELAPVFSPVDLGIALHVLAKTYARQPLAQAKEIRVETEGDLRVVTDPTLVRRVLSNLLKNALEAESPPCAVTLSAREQGREVRVSVHNPCAMNEQAKVEVFHRCYTSKGYGRGLGTYSVKLLCERYLQAKVGFSSSRDQGTTFWVLLPKEVEEA